MQQIILHCIELKKSQMNFENPLIHENALAHKIPVIYLHNPNILYQM